ncbi:MAG: head-tail adaptor protein [Bryobacterales bacterium]|nr:head-tail adaptor protein [Bryobacterales bacterium]
MKDCVQLRHRVTLQSLTLASDGQGGFDETWDTVADLWAEIKPMNGWERMQGMQLETPVTHKVTIRYRNDITAKDRLLFGSRVLQIKELLNRDERNFWLDLKCQEVSDIVFNSIWNLMTEHWDRINTPWGSLG